VGFLYSNEYISKPEDGKMKIKIVFLAAMLTAVLCISGNLWAGTYSGGGGTAGNPYKIANVTDWQELMGASTEWDKHFVLVSHIDLAGITPTPVGNSVNKFTGVFDGQGYTISNVVINQPTGSNVGLFGYVSLATVCNVRIENAAITGRWMVGGLAGYLDSSTIHDIAFNGSVTGNAYVGGAAGVVVAGGQVSRCYSRGVMTGSRYVGGLIGATLSAALDNSYSQAAVVGVEDIVSGKEDIGGLVGGLFGAGVTTIDNCYASGSVSAIPGTLIVGGLIGKKETGTVTDCFWDTQASGQATSDGGIGKTTVEMMIPAAFTSAGWDFVNTWGIVPVQTYPYLRTQPSADLNYDGGVDLADFAIFAAQWLQGI
jgi:hypothetical protein